jgi:hypothetical protein|tara:strand:- start:289 stop:480 length:192 start_codon:yes stop_codon:yes gene_type:complete
MLAQQQPAAVAEKEAAFALCRHHWIIEPANGPVSRGVCRNCQETRQFRNSVGDPERDFQIDSA